MIELRDYQHFLFDQTRRSFASGHKKVLVVAPCGAGKSFIFAKMAEQSKGDVLVLTHRRELLNQTGSLLAENGIRARVAMVLTEANHLGDYSKPNLIITDEAHLSMSNTWKKVLDYYDTYTVGFTATPIRLDGKPLGDVYDDLVQGVNTKWLINHERLAPFVYYAPPIADASDLRIRAGDYIIGDLEKLMCDRAVYSDVLSTWKRLAEGQKTIAYCVSIKHAKEVAQTFAEAGYSAVELDGSVPDKKRTEIMKDFREGKIQVLCNVGIISEGVSIDDVNCCLLLRPTDSHALYWQQAMRCMRYAPGKTAIIIDAVGNYSRNPMPDADVEWSLDKKASKPRRVNSEGNFTIRVCPNCFMTFATAPVCPHCGTDYPLHPREIKAHEEIELSRISQEQAEEVERQRKKMRMEVGRARTLPELLAIAKARGYSPQWAYRMMQVRGKKR